MKPYDLIVIGAGPAGSSAAMTAAGACRVALVERREQIGVPVQCAEYVPAQIRQYVTLQEQCIAQRLEGFVFYICGRPHRALRAPGYILQRRFFDTALVEQAVARGVHLLQPARALAPAAAGITISYRGSEEHLAGRYILGADGPRSAVRRWCGLPSPRLMAAVQYELSIKGGIKQAHFYFHPRYRHGYAWLFPKGKFANVGVTAQVEHRGELQAMLRSFLKDLERLALIEEMRPTNKTAGWVPVDGPLPDLVQAPYLWAGDAAGQTHPVSGGGILPAVRGGILAAEAVMAAVAEQNDSKLYAYNNVWREQYGAYYARASRSREQLIRGWTTKEADFIKLIEKTWLASPL